MRKSKTYKKRRGGQYATSAPTSSSSFGDTASQYGEKAKQSITSGFTSLSNWFSNLGKPSASPAQYSAAPYSPTPTYTSSTGGRRRHRFKTRRNRKTRKY
jgi:hypothetical protein